MTDNEVELFYNKLLEHYCTLPCHIQEPIRFAYFVKLYKYYNDVEETAVIPSVV